MRLTIHSCKSKIVDTSEKENDVHVSRCRLRRNGVVPFDIRWNRIIFRNVQEATNNRRVFTRWATTSPYTSVDFSSGNVPVCDLRARPAYGGLRVRPDVAVYAVCDHAIVNCPGVPRCAVATSSLPYNIIRGILTQKHFENIILKSVLKSLQSKLCFGRQKLICCLCNVVYNIFSTLGFDLNLGLYSCWDVYLEWFKL